MDLFKKMMIILPFKQRQQVRQGTTHIADDRYIDRGAQPKVRRLTVDLDDAGLSRLWIR